MPDGRVKIVAEGEEKNLEHLANSSNIKNTLINVEHIEHSYSEASGDFSEFSKLVKGGETDERLDTAANLLKELIVATNKGFSSLNNTISSGFNTMAEKQDLQLEITKNGFNDMRAGFTDLKKKMRTGFADLREEIHLQRDDFKEVFMNEVSELRSEIFE